MSHNNLVLCLGISTATTPASILSAASDSI